jgi:hypothetical protein
MTFMPVNAHWRSGARCRCRAVQAELMAMRQENLRAIEDKAKAIEVAAVPEKAAKWPICR